MVKRRVLVIFAVAILSCFLFAQDIIEIRKLDGSLYAGWFTEQVEIIYIVMWNGAIYRITNHLPDRVGFNGKQFFEDTGHTPADIMIWIHNHFQSPYPSEEDIKTYFKLCEAGFRGFYMIYLQGAKQVTLIEGYKNERSK